VKNAAFFGVALLATSLGCNSILGIDAAKLDPSDGGSDSAMATPDANPPTTDSNAPSEAAACSLHAKDPCNACVAQNCCTEFDACIASATCKAGLVKYAFCLGNNFTSDAGASCDEDFLSSAGAESASLAQCAFMDHCQSACKDQTIGDLCFTYCNCMDDVCPAFTFDGGTCADICSKFDPNQLVCRPYHCNLATQNRLDEPKRLLHCGHASGNTPCH
jgi:hypothetical protein